MRGILIGPGVASTASTARRQVGTMDKDRTVTQRA